MPSNSHDETFNHFWDRLDRLEEEKKAIADDTKDTYAEMKSAGYDVKLVKKARAEAKREAEVRENERMEVDAMLAARGLL